MTKQGIQKTSRRGRGDSGRSSRIQRAMQYLVLNTTTTTSTTTTNCVINNVLVSLQLKTVTTTTVFQLVSENHNNNNNHTNSSNNSGNSNSQFITKTIHTISEPISVSTSAQLLTQPPLCTSDSTPHTSVKLENVDR